MALDWDEFYRVFGETGELPELDQLECSVDSTTPMLGASTVLRWHASGGVYGVNVLLNGELWLVDQPAVGEHELAIDCLASISLCVNFGDQSQELQINPRVLQPEFTRIKVKPAVSVGEPIKVSYGVASAERVEIRCIEAQLGYSEVIINNGDRVGDCEFIVSAPGEYSLTLVACSEHAALSELGVKSVTQTVAVHYPLPIISRFVSASKIGWVGQPQRLEWRTSRAERVCIEDDVGSELEVEPCGQVTLTPRLQAGQVQYQLVAVNLEGVQVRKSLVVDWRYAKPELGLQSSTKKLGLGDLAHVQWRVKNCLQWWLEIDGSAVNKRIELDQMAGNFSFVPMANAEVNLVALTYQGIEVRKKLNFAVAELPSWAGADQRLHDIDSREQMPSYWLGSFR